jgi:putative DNA primase/helicase
MTPLTEADREQIKQAVRKSTIYHDDMEVPTAIPELDFTPKTNGDGVTRVEKEAAKVIKKAVTGKMIRTASDGIKPCMSNALLLLRTSHAWNGASGHLLKLNEFDSKIEVTGTTPTGKTAGEVWTDVDDTLTLEWMEKNEVFLGSSSRSGEAVRAVASENRYHPVRQYLSGLKWDSRPRLERLFPHYAGAENTPLNQATGRVFLVGAVARIMSPGSKYDLTPLLIGKQGIGKSTFCRNLCPDPKYFADHLSELGSKDSMQELRGKMLIEFSELDRLKGAELARVKAYLTKLSDHYRPSYGRTEVDIPRQCVFIGTSNDEIPLNDATGGRRFIPIKCGRMHVEELRADVNEIWAEAYSRYQRGAKWFLDSEQLIKEAEEQQRLAYCPGLWDDIIERFLEKPSPRTVSDREFLSIRGRVLLAEVLAEGIGKTQDKWTPMDQRSVVQALTHLGYQRKQVRVGDRRPWFYVNPDHLDE